MLLKRGDKNDNVKTLQQILHVEPVSGYFGPITEAAVIKWQKAHGYINTNPIINDKMWAELLGFNPDIRSTLSASLAKLKGTIPDTVISEITSNLHLIPNPTILILSHLISQCMVESANFTRKIENLNYSALGLQTTFNKYFPTILLAKLYANKSEKIANIVYANRLGNGDVGTGDGWRYRGRGYIQLTGKANYREFSDYLGQDFINQPDLVTNYALETALFYFNKTNLWTICAQGSTEEVITKVTKVINGGTHGLDKRIANFNLIYHKMLT